MIEQLDILYGTITTSGQPGPRGPKGDPGKDGVTSYPELNNKPTLEGVTIEDDKTFADYNLIHLTNAEIDEIFRTV